MEYLDADLSGLIPKFPYFNEFVEYFVNREYERGKTIRAAPYDWRLAPGVCCVACANDRQALARTAVAFKLGILSQWTL